MITKSALSVILTGFPGICWMDNLCPQTVAIAINSFRLSANS